MVRKSKYGHVPKDAVPGIGVDATLSQHRTLWEFLSLPHYEDGEARKPGTLLVCVEDGLWKAWLHDNDGKASVWLSGETLSDLLEALSDGIDSDGLQWRRDRPKPAGSRR